MADPEGKPRRQQKREKRLSDTGGSIGNVSTVSSVIREQYCMCAPTSKLEKRLIIVVLVLLVVVTALLAALIAVSVNQKAVQKVLASWMGFLPKEI